MNKVYTVQDIANLLRRWGIYTEEAEVELMMNSDPEAGRQVERLSCELVMDNIIINRFSPIDLEGIIKQELTNRAAAAVSDLWTLKVSIDDMHQQRRIRADLLAIVPKHGAQRPDPIQAIAWYP